MLSEPVKSAFQTLIKSPSLENSRSLEEILRRENYEKQIFGRINQKSSIEAASESDRGITERLANALDASLTAARLALGVPSDKKLTPRVAAQRFFCAQA